jgi:hypothetical protein
MRRSRNASGVLALVAVAALLIPGAGLMRAADAADAAAPQTRKTDVSCEMAFTMKGWSAIVSGSKGEGMVSCNNGQRAAVVLEITGGGLTFGRTQIDEGKGVFSDVTDISEIFGAYALAEASAAAGEAVGAQALTKGEVSLAITTKGRGWSLGVAGAKFSITRAEAD